MSFTFPPTIRGWSTVVRSLRGRAGIRIPASGLTGRSFPLASALASDGTAALDGAGAAGDSIGITATRFMAVDATIREAAHFTTATPSIAEAIAAIFARVGLSAATVTPPEVTLTEAVIEAMVEAMTEAVPAARAASAQEPLADTTAAARPAGSLHAVNPASVAVGFAAAVVDFTAAVEAAINHRVALVLPTGS